MAEERDDQFMIELHKLMLAYEALVEEYDMRGKLISIFAAGILEPVDDDTSNMKASFNYMIDNKDELQVMLDFISDTYEEHRGMDDLEDLLGGLGISLN